jgi:hypothetical protein
VVDESRRGNRARTKLQVVRLKRRGILREEVIGKGDEKMIDAVGIRVVLCCSGWL